MSTQVIVAAQLFFLALAFAMAVFALHVDKHKYASGFWAQAIKVTDTNAYANSLVVVGVITVLLSANMNVGTAVWHFALDTVEQGASVAGMSLMIVWSIATMVCTAFTATAVFGICYEIYLKAAYKRKLAKERFSLVG